MAIRPFTLCIETTYRTPDDASGPVRRKKDHVFNRTALHVANEPHVQCSYRMGTEPAGADTDDFFGYAGLAPDSPVVLGSFGDPETSRTAQYLSAKRQTGIFGSRTIRAVCECALLGVAIGVAVCGTVGCLAGCYFGAEAVKLYLRHAIVPRIATGLLSASLVVHDWREYRAANLYFNALHKMSAAYDDLSADNRTPDLIRDTRLKIAEIYAGTDWLLHQACGEYMEKLEDIGLINRAAVA